MRDDSLDQVLLDSIIHPRKSYIPICPCYFRQLLQLGTHCLLYTSDAADDMQCVDLGGRRIIKKKKIFFKQKTAYEM